MSHRELALTAWESLFRTQHEIFAHIQADFNDGPLSPAEYDVLLTLSRHPQHTARLKDITAAMLISQPSVSRLIDRMAGAQLVIKNPDPQDRRGALVTATNTGISAFRSMATKHGKSIANRLSALSEAELETLLELTEKLRTWPGGSH